MPAIETDCPPERLRDEDIKTFQPHELAERRISTPNSCVSDLTGFSELRLNSVSSGMHKPILRDLHDVRCDVMMNWLYQQQMERLWTDGSQDEGVVLKKSREAFSCCPSDLAKIDDGFYKAVVLLNVRVGSVTWLI